MPENSHYSQSKAGLFGLGVVTTGVIQIVDDPHILESNEVRHKVIAGLTFLIVVCITLYSWIKNDGILKSIKDSQEENKLLHEQVGNKVRSQSEACSNLTVPVLQTFDLSIRLIPSLVDLKKPNYMMNREVIILSIFFWFLDLILNKLFSKVNDLNYVAGSLLILFAVTHIFSAHYLREQVDLLAEEKISLLDLDKQANLLIKNGLSAELERVKRELAVAKADLALEEPGSTSTRSRPGSGGSTEV